MRELTRNCFGKPRAPFIPRLKNPSYPNGSWTERQIYYDSYSVAVATLTVGQLTTMFSVPLGGAKTLASTNMRDYSKIADGNLFVIMGFGVAVSFNTLPSDVSNILEVMTVKLKIGGVTFAQGKILLYPGGRGGVVGGAAMPTAISSTTLIAGVTNGIASVDNMVRFVKGIQVDAGQTVGVELVSEGAGFTSATAAVGGSGFTLTAILDGIETRKVA
jgi:hypothetical protein